MSTKHAVPRTPKPEAEPGLKLRFEDRFNLLDPIQVMPFQSFGTPGYLHVRGRVIEQQGVEGKTERSQTWQNVLNMLQRLDSDEIPGATLRAHFRGRTWEATSDEEGYFVFDLEVDEPIDPGWHEVEVELVESVGKPAERTVQASVLVPSPEARFAVVSDVDDTIIETHSTAFVEQLAILFGKDARERTSFPGVPALYRALAEGADGTGHNPIFYVSQSGWNLYDLLVEFLKVKEIPRGPLFLSDLSVIEDKSAVLGHDRHKFVSIDLLLRTYPDLPFILVGDSGMRDPELYQELARKHPGRIRAIYIHDVSPPERDREVRRIAEELEQEGIPLLRMEHADRAAEHAADAGFINHEQLEAVRQAVRDEAGADDAS